MTQPEQSEPDTPPPGERSAQDSVGHERPGAAGGSTGDPDPRDPTEDASDPGSTGADQPPPQEPPD